MKMFRNVASVLVVVLLLGLAACASASEKPGDSQYSWVNGTWSGEASSGWHQTFELKVVDGNKVVGRQDVEMEGRSGGGSLEGTVTGNIIQVTVYKNTTATYTITKGTDGNSLFAAHGESGSTTLLRRKK